MIITLDAGQLRCDFAYHKEIVERIKTVPGATFDKAQKTWYVPTAQADRLMEAMPLAQFSYAAISAACDAEAQRAQNFVDGLRFFGLVLRLDNDGAVVVEGVGVSPVIREAVMVRADAVQRVLASEHPCQNAAKLEKRGSATE